MKLDEKTINQIKDYFAGKPEVTAVYLYGSFARGDAKSDSDIDLAVLVEESDKYQGFAIPQVVFAQDLTEKLGREVEVQDLKAVRVDFAHRVLSEGQLLYSGNEKVRIEFEEMIIRDFFLLKPFLDEYYYYLGEIAKKGELGVRYI